MMARAVAVTMLSAARSGEAARGRAALTAQPAAHGPGRYAQADAGPQTVGLSSTASGGGGSAAQQHGRPRDHGSRGARIPGTARAGPAGGHQEQPGSLARNDTASGQIAECQNHHGPSAYAAWHGRAAAELAAYFRAKTRLPDEELARLTLAARAGGQPVGRHRRRLRRHDAQGPSRSDLPESPAKPAAELLFSATQDAVRQAHRQRSAARAADLGVSWMRAAGHRPRPGRAAGPRRTRPRPGLRPAGPRPGRRGPAAPRAGPPPDPAF